MRVGANCVVRHAILDTGCVVPDGMQIGVNPQEDASRFHVSEGRGAGDPRHAAETASRGSSLGYDSGLEQSHEERPVMIATFKALLALARSRAAVVLAVLLPLAGCATMAPKLEPPRLTVVSIGMVSADIFSQQFRVRLHVQNPNSRSIPIKAIDYELLLESSSFAEGNASEPFVVPARGENEFDMTVRTNFVSSIGRLLSRMNGRDNSKVSYAIGQGRRRHPLPSRPFRSRTRAASTSACCARSPRRPAGRRGARTPCLDPPGEVACHAVVHDPSPRFPVLVQVEGGVERPAHGRRVKIVEDDARALAAPCIPHLHGIGQAACLPDDRHSTISGCTSGSVRKVRTATA